MTKTMTKVLFVATVALVMQACAKKEQKPAGATPTAGGGAPTPAVPAPVPVADSADYLKVVAAHHQPNPKDPVIIGFPGFRVLGASYRDASDLSGGSAELEIDVTSLTSGNEMRDNHLKAADYFDAALHPRAHVVVKDVQKTAADRYRANAVVTLHGLVATVPVTFEVIERTATGLRIRGEATLNRRTQFQIGKAPGEGETSAEEVKVQLQLTLPNPGA